MKVRPSPNPVASCSAPKSSIVVPGRDQPETTRFVPATTASSRTGKFSRSFGPVSTSPGSLSVTSPSDPRSMPMPVFSKMLLFEMRLPATMSPGGAATCTPGPPLKAITLPRMILPVTVSTAAFPCQQTRQRRVRDGQGACGISTNEVAHDHVVRGRRPVGRRLPSDSHAAAAPARNDVPLLGHRTCRCRRCQ